MTASPGRPRRTAAGKAASVPKAPSARRAAPAAAGGHTTPRRSKTPSERRSEAPSERRTQRLRRRDLILEAAAGLFAKNGFAATGIDEIGAAAGITGPGVYRHFASKDEILKTLVQQAAEGLLTTNETSPIDDGEPPAVALRRMVETLVDDCLEYGAVAYVAWNEARNLAPQTRAWLARLHRLRAAEWVHVLSRLRPESTDVELLTMVNAVYGMVIEAVNYDTGLDRERTRELLVGAASRALVSSSARRPRR